MNNTICKKRSVQVKDFNCQKQKLPSNPILCLSFLGLVKSEQLVLGKVDRRNN
ncbi:hypothetical protein BH09BAC5_BH09BAC5_19690 [soil metagenome]